MSDVRRLVDDQVAYYRARAAEYDDYYTRQGQFDQGPEETTIWLEELDAAARVGIDEVDGDVLEIAAGTGWWTYRLAAKARTVTAIDAAPEMLAINAERTSHCDNVRLVQADVFAYDPHRTFDAIFFAFWLSHVPLTLFDDFWSRVRRWLKPNSKAIFLDNLESSAPSIQARPDEHEAELMQRTLRDGRQFTIVKTVWTPDALRGRLEPNWHVEAGTTERFFLYGTATYDAAADPR